MGNEKNTKKNSNKIFALITYIIAFICLLLGLFLPYNFDDPVNTMIGLQIPAAFDAVYTFGNGMQAMFNTPALDPALSFTLEIAEISLNLGAALLVLYAVVVVIGLFALIPAIVSTCADKKKSKSYATEVVKKHSNVALGAASFVEVLAILVLSVYSFLHIATLDAILSFNYSILAAFGGTLLMLIVQAFFYKGGSGFMKFILAIFSGLVVVLIYGVTFIIPPVEGLLANFDLSALFTGEGANANVLEAMAGLITGASFNFEGKEVTVIILEMSVMVFGYLAFINFVLDLMGLGKRTNKFMIVVNIIRYVLEFIAAALILIMTFFIEGITFGYLSIAVVALVALSLVFNIFRAVASPKKKKGKGKDKAPATAKEETTAAPAKDDKKGKKEPKSEKPAKGTPAPVVAEEKNEPDQKVYTPVLYNGPSDDFIKTLTNEQKVEFSRVFLERQNGALPQIPDYVVGGKNDKFFSSLFIYYARVRDMISDELMNAFYKQANVM